jgi:hypothetical protein
MLVRWCGANSAWVNYGSSAELSIKVYNGIKPYTVTWKRNGMPINSGGNVSISTPSTNWYCDSTIKFENVQGNIAGITAEVTDFMGRTVTVYPSGNIYVRFPYPFSPYIDDVTATIWTGTTGGIRETAPLTGGCCDRSVRHYNNSWDTTGKETTTQVQISLQARDVNPQPVRDGLNLGSSLVYDWKKSTDPWWRWERGGSSKVVTLSSGEKATYNVRVYLNNIFNSSYRSLYAYLTVSVNHAGCFPPTVTTGGYGYGGNTTNETITVNAGETRSFQYNYIASPLEGYSLQNNGIYKLGQTTRGPWFWAGAISNYKFTPVYWGYRRYYYYYRDKITFDKTFSLCDGKTQKIIARFDNDCGSKTITTTVNVVKGPAVTTSGGGTVGFSRNLWNNTLQPYSQYSYFHLYNVAQYVGLRRGLRNYGSQYKIKEGYFKVWKLSSGAGSWTALSGWIKFNETRSGPVTWSNGCVRLSTNRISAAAYGYAYFYGGYSSCWNNGDKICLEIWSNPDCPGSSAGATRAYVYWTINVYTPPRWRYPVFRYPRYYIPTYRLNLRRYNIYDVNNNTWQNYQYNYNTRTQLTGRQTYRRVNRRGGLY